MTEMQIPEVVTTKQVIDYDFMLTTGLRLPITLEPDNGDTASELGDRYLLDITAKQNPVDPTVWSNAELISVFKAQIAALAIRNRKQKLPTPEELFEMHKTLHTLSSTVQ